MSNRTMYPAKSYGSSRVYADFVFTAPGAGGAVAAASIDGCDLVASITHVGASNKVTVTLKDTFNKVIGVEPMIRGTTGKRASAGGVLNEGTSTPIAFDIYTWTAAGLADADNADVISVRLALRNGNWGTK